jgi:hypothetical protein
MTDIDSPVTGPRARTTPRAVPRATGARRPAPLAPPPRTPPPRPRLTSTLAPPVGTPEPPRPRAAVVSAVLWSAAAIAGGLGVLAALADGAALRATLEAAAGEADPAASAELVDDGVDTTILLVVCSLTLLVALTVLGTALLLRRRRWSRGLLLATGLLTLAAVGIAQSVVAGGVDLDRIGLLVQLGLVVAALVTLASRSVRGWLRGDGA